MPGLFDRRYNHNYDHRVPVRARRMAGPEILVPVAAETITDRFCAQAYTIVMKDNRSMRETIRS